MSDSTHAPSWGQRTDTLVVAKWWFDYYWKKHNHTVKGTRSQKHEGLMEASKLYQKAASVDLNEAIANLKWVESWYYAMKYHPPLLDEEL